VYVSQTNVYTKSWGLGCVWGQYKKKTFVRGTDEFNHDSALRSYEMYMQHGIRVHIRDYIVMLQGRYGWRSRIALVRCGSTVNPLNLCWCATIAVKTLTVVLQ
jgi:hypothetical protein